MRKVLATTIVLGALLSVPALAATAINVDLLKTFRSQITAVKKKTSVPVLLPASLPFAGKVPKLYATGGATGVTGTSSSRAPRTAAARLPASSPPSRERRAGSCRRSPTCA
jgi:hypothetical protein